MIKRGIIEALEKAMADRQKHDMLIEHASYHGLLPDYDTDYESTYDELSNILTEDSTSLTGLLPDHTTNDECAYAELSYFTEDSTSLTDISSSKGDIEEIKE
ncbi:uncharacterized protein LOC127725732 isoform X2 [Mytilus californianus]|uniref:uncharacterized protein LOC127725732 isoform X2 n=1 Tax=Mytilus californianus TaxID=6549 RepID=UPI002245BF7C|nr:uncharacterized protein LOC127725732 isoform X2 [Mytilus californianus]